MDAKKTNHNNNNNNNNNDSSSSGDKYVKIELQIRETTI